MMFFSRKVTECLYVDDSVLYQLQKVCRVDPSVHSENSHKIFGCQCPKKKEAAIIFFRVARQNRQVIKRYVNHMARNESVSLGTHGAKIRALRIIKDFPPSAFM